MLSSVKRAGRRLQLEALERRELLSAVSPLAPEMPMQIGTTEPALVATNAERHWPSAAQAAVMTPHVYDGWANAQWPQATGAEEIVTAFQPDTILKGISYNVIGSDGAVAMGTISADLDFDGYYEFELGTDDGTDGVLSFDLGWGNLIPQAGFSLQVELEFAPNAEAGEYQLSEPEVEISRWGRRVNVTQFGYDNPTITVEQSAEMHIGIYSPASKTFQPGQTNVALAYVNFDISEPVSLHTSVLIEGNAFVDDVKFRNTVTGRTFNMALDPWGTFEGSQVYTVSNIDLQYDGSNVWEIRADVADTAEEGDNIRATVLNGVVIEGRYFSTYAYQADGGGDVEITPDGRIAGNWHEIGDIPHLSIAQVETGTTDTAVSGQQDIELLRFEMSAGDVEDLLLTKAVFEAEQGDLLNGENYALWVDTDGNSVVDTILEDGGYIRSDQITFSDLAAGGYVILQAETVVFEVRADVSPTLSSDPSLQLGFAVNTSDYIEVEELDEGSNLVGIVTDGVGPENGQITVATADATLWSFVNQGDLYVTQSTIPLRNHQYLGGELGESALRLAFRAQNEPIDVTDLQLSVPEGQGVSIDRFELYKEGEATPFALATIGGVGNDQTPAGYDTFAANMESRQLVIPEGEEVEVLVRPRIKSDVQGGISGEELQVYVISTPVADPVTGAGAVRARGDVSSNNLDANDEDTIAEGEIFIGVSSPGANQDIVGNADVIVMSKIISITNANPDANGSAVPIGQSDVGMFKFSGANNTNFKNGWNTSVIDAIAFNVNATNVTLENEAAIYNQADSGMVGQFYQLVGNTYQPVAGSTATGNLLAVFDNLYGSDVDTEIDPGDDITLILSLNVLDQNNSPVGAPSTLQASLQRHNLADAVFGLDSGDSHISWLDADVDLNRFDWVEYPVNDIKSTRYEG